MLKWNPSSWKKAKIIKQMPIYSDLVELQRIKNEILTFDGLVNINDISELKCKLSEVARGNKFVIIGGDCAESFYDNENNIISTVQTIREMADILSKKFNKEIIRIGRMAGQYAKPRSSNVEIREGIELPVYRGDIVNSNKFDKKSRTPDPKLIKTAYYHSNKTIKLIKKIDNNFYISHESLLLDYEEAMVRELNNTYFLASTHFPWIGDRTRSIDSAHIEFLRGLINPIAIKCSKDTNIDELIQIINILNPSNEIGKISLTIRIGVDNIEQFLPALITKIKNENLNVIWIVDPMHGNTKKINGLKVRYLDDIIKETNSFIKICKNNGVYPGGIHLEMSGLNLTECIGLSVNENNIGLCNTTLCDPRLNREQSLYLINNIS